MIWSYLKIISSTKSVFKEKGRKVLEVIITSELFINMLHFDPLIYFPTVSLVHLETKFWKLQVFKPSCKLVLMSVNQCQSSKWIPLLLYWFCQRVFVSKQTLTKWRSEDKLCYVFIVTNWFLLQFKHKWLLVCLQFRMWLKIRILNLKRMIRFVSRIFLEPT